MVVKVEVFTSDSCPHCPAAVNVANEAKEVLGDAADIIVCNIASEENRQKAIGLGIMAVPTIAINDEVAFVGAPASVSVNMENTTGDIAAWLNGLSTTTSFSGYFARGASGTFNCTMGWIAIGRWK